MSKKPLSKVEKKIFKEDLEFLEDKIDYEDSMKVLKDINKNGYVSWDKVKDDLNI